MPPRARLLAAAAAVVGAPALWGRPALAEQAPGKSPEALQVTGRAGPHADVNGRWSIMFGKKLNDRVVYKKDGGLYYLMVNNCGQFQMSEKVTGDCNGFAIKTEGGWKVDGQADPAMKMKPWEESKEDIYNDRNLF